MDPHLLSATEAKEVDAALNGETIPVGVDIEGKTIKQSNVVPVVKKATEKYY